MALPSFCLTTRIPLVPDRAAPKRSRPGGAAPGQPWHLAFSIQAQQRTNWCWAAVAVSVATYYDPATHWTQCLLANAELGRDDCCEDIPVCNVASYLDTALERVGHLREWETSPASFEGVVEEVDAGNPLCARIEWPNGRGHFVALIGYARAGGRVAADEVVVADPHLGVTRWEYARFRKVYRHGGIWDESFWCR
jgi:hypothetical protein